MVGQGAFRTVWNLSISQHTQYYVQKNVPMFVCRSRSSKILTVTFSVDKARVSWDEVQLGSKKAYNHIRVSPSEPQLGAGAPMGLRLSLYNIG